MEANKKLRVRSGFWIIVVAAVVLELTAGIQYFCSRKAIQDEAALRAKSELRNAELEINVVTAQLESAAKTLSMMAEKNLKSSKAMYTCTRTLLETLDYVESAGVAFVPYYYKNEGKWFEICSSRVDGDIYTRQIGGEHHNYLTTEWFNNGLTIDSCWWCEPYYDEAGAETMVVSCSYPIRDPQGKVVAVVCVDLSLDRLSHISQYLQIYKDSYYSIRSSTGLDIVGEPDTVPGRRYCVFDEEIDATGWHISIIIPEDVLFADLRRIGLLITLLMLVGLALLIFILYRSGKGAQQLITMRGQQQKIANELDVAQTIQQAMLPKVFPPFLDRKDLNIYGMVRPAKEIGGDLYDFYIRHDKLFFCVGDVSGKGIPAALVMATTRSLFRSITAHEEHAEEIVAQMNSTMAEQNEQNMFVTLFLGVLDLQNGQLEYCNAGHNAPYIVKSGESSVERLEVQPNLPLGIDGSYAYVAQRAQIKYGDMLFLYTDGLTEAENEQHELFGERRMKEALEQMHGLRPRTIIDGMEAGVAAFVGGAQQSDDLTMMAIRYQIPAIIMRNDIQQIPTLAEWIDGLGIPKDLNMPVNLALEEAVTNVMLYAYPGQNDGKVFVEFVKDDKLIFTITDSGIPFDPTQQAEADIYLSAEERSIGGLGIHLVRQLMDEIRYERIDNKNILTLVKQL